MKKYALIALGIFFVILAKDSPMALMFVLWIFVYLAREKLSTLASKMPRWVSFIGFGILFGLSIEIFAIYDNLSTPDEQKILIDPNPYLDLFYGVFSYGMVISTWYFLLRKREFSKTQIVLTSGMYGILTEQFSVAAGPVILLNIFGNPLVGIGYAVLVVFVYGIFPMLAYMITRHQFIERARASMLFCLFSVSMLWFQWAIFGNFVLPALKNIL